MWEWTNNKHPQWPHSLWLKLCYKSKQYFIMYSFPCFLRALHYQCCVFTWDPHTVHRQQESHRGETCTFPGGFGNSLPAFCLLSATPCLGVELPDKLSWNLNYKQSNHEQCWIPFFYQLENSWLAVAHAVCNTDKNLPSSTVLKSIHVNPR